MQVLAEMGQSKAVAFDQIDKVYSLASSAVGSASLCCCASKVNRRRVSVLTLLLPLQAPEEKARGITIATAHGELRACVAISPVLLSPDV